MAFALKGFGLSMNKRLVILLLSVVLIAASCKGGGSSEGGAAPGGPGLPSPAPSPTGNGGTATDASDAELDAQFETAQLVGGIEKTGLPALPPGSLDLIEADRQSGALTDVDALLQKLYFVAGDAKFNQRYLQGVEAGANDRISCGNAILEEVEKYVAAHPDSYDTFKNFIPPPPAAPVSSSSFSFITKAFAQTSGATMQEIQITDSCHGNQRVSVRLPDAYAREYREYIVRTNCVQRVALSCPWDNTTNNQYLEFIFDKDLGGTEMFNQLKSAETEGKINCKLRLYMPEGRMKPLDDRNPYRIFVFDPYVDTTGVTREMDASLTIRYGDRSAIFLSGPMISKDHQAVFRHTTVALAQEDILRGTLAHEMAHAQEDGYNQKPHLLKEALATAFEDIVFRSGNSELEYAPRLVEETVLPYLEPEDGYGPILSAWGKDLTSVVQANNSLYRSYSRYMFFPWEMTAKQSFSGWDYVKAIKNGINPFKAFEQILTKQGPRNEVWAEWAAALFNPPNNDFELATYQTREKDGKPYPLKASVEFTSVSLVPVLGPSKKKFDEEESFYKIDRLVPSSTQYHWFKLHQWKQTRFIEFQVKDLDPEYASLSVLLVKHSDGDAAVAPNAEMGTDYKVLQNLRPFRVDEKVSFCFSTLDETPDSIVFLMANTKLDGSTTPMHGEIRWRSTNACKNPHMTLTYQVSDPPRHTESETNDSKTVTDYRLQKTIRLQGELEFQPLDKAALIFFSLPPMDQLLNSSIYGFPDAAATINMSEFKEEIVTDKKTGAIDRDDGYETTFNEETPLFKKTPIHMTVNGQVLMDDPEGRVSNAGLIVYGDGNYAISLQLWFGEGTSEIWNKTGVTNRTTGEQDMTLFSVSCHGTYADGATELASSLDSKCLGMDGTGPPVAWRILFPGPLHYSNKSVPLPPIVPLLPPSGGS